jgi:hypothetical protein
MLGHRIRGVLSATLVLLASALATAVPAGAATRHHSTHHAPAHHSHRVTHHPSTSGIPQNGGGDGDSDNFGGPSDGDGNL